MNCEPQSPGRLAQFANCGGGSFYGASASRPCYSFDPVEVTGMSSASSSLSDTHGALSDFAIDREFCPSSSAQVCTYSAPPPRQLPCDSLCLSSQMNTPPR